MKDKVTYISVNIARVILGFTFIVSGTVKAVDPHGTEYKLHDYLDALGLTTIAPDWLLIIAAIVLSTLEILIGAMILLAIWRRVITKVALLFMAVMTLITVWIFYANPVQDCGCFGDAFILTNSQTLAKNIVLLACAIITVIWPQNIKRVFSKTNQWMLTQFVFACSIGVSLWCLYDLPLLDFRPYHIGADIKKGMEIPDNAEQPEFETTFIMEKDGETKEFSLDNYPDSTWTFVDSKTTTIKQGYIPPIHDFSIVTTEGDDITEEVLSNEGYTFLLISPYLENADDSNFGIIDQIYEFAQDNSIKFYCLTASTDKGIAHWQNITGAEYPFCNTDGTTLKTIVRSNPGLVLLKDGVITGKWSCNFLPENEELSKLTH